MRLVISHGMRALYWSLEPSGELPFLTASCYTQGPNQHGVSDTPREASEQLSRAGAATNHHLLISCTLRPDCGKFPSARGRLWGRWCSFRVGFRL